MSCESADDYGLLLAQLETLEAENKRLRKALGWYVEALREARHPTKGIPVKPTEDI
jgi:hypothetical protein